ncbi:hypothetical protein KRX54_04915 [Actinomycetaceae bacterium TAE3-ERU4]|nr:hypothetical protein [Actinomycetaceae bacterium TAE3-ERU4]
MIKRQSPDDSPRNFSWIKKILRRKESLPTVSKRVIDEEFEQLTQGLETPLPSLDLEETDFTKSPKQIGPRDYSLVEDNSDFVPETPPALKELLGKRGILIVLLLSLLLVLGILGALKIILPAILRIIFVIIFFSLSAGIIWLSRKKKN